MSDKNTDNRNRDDLSPSYRRSLGGFFKPGHDTARQGAAGTTFLLAAAGATVLAALGVALAARRRS